MKLVVTIESTDDTDLDWLKPRIEGAVEETITIEQEEDRIDGDLTYDVAIDYE